MEKNGMLTVASTETCSLHCYLDVALLGWPERALLVAEVLCAVEDDGVVGGERDGRHGDVGGKGGNWGLGVGRLGRTAGAVYILRIESREGALDRSRSECPERDRPRV